MLPIIDSTPETLLLYTKAVQYPGFIGNMGHNSGFSVLLTVSAVAITTENMFSARKYKSHMYMYTMYRIQH